VNIYSRVKKEMKYRKVSKKKNCEYRPSKRVRRYEYYSCWEWGVRLSDRTLAGYILHKEGIGFNK
jgi:hypothetical protein